MLVHALEPSHHHHFPVLQGLKDSTRIDALDSGLPVGIVGFDSNLMTEKRTRLVPELFDRQRQQSHRDLLPRGQQHIPFPLVGHFGDLLGQSDQAVRLARHRRDHDDEVVAGPLGR